MSRKQQKNMKRGGGLFDFLGFKKATDISVDERTKRLKELENKPAKDLAAMVVNLESEIKELKNPKQNPSSIGAEVAAAGAVIAADEAAVEAAKQAVGGKRRKSQKTRKNKR